MVATLKPIQILGAALVELLNGELSDETIAAVDNIKREDVPGPLSNLVGMMHGMSTLPRLRGDIIHMLQDEIRIAVTEALEKHSEHRSPIGADWTVMYSILEEVLQGSDYDLRGTADVCAGAGLDLINPDHVPAWARPLAEHIKNSATRDDDLTLELLDELEKIIQKRRTELTK